MKKFISVIMSLASVAACAFTFTACDSGDNSETHTNHNWSATYTEDGDRHYQSCGGCNEKNYAPHSYNADGVCVCGKQKPADGGEVLPPEDDAELQAMSTYFNGLKVAENKTAITDGDNSTKTFEQVLDRQFTVLAQDILYRLYLVYGENTYGAQSTFQDLDLNYSYSGNAAKVVKSKALTDLTGHDTQVGNHQYENTDCVWCYQDFINEGLGHNRLSNKEYIRVDGAIFGAYTSFDGRQLTETKNNDKTWLFNDYTKWDTDYRTAFKTELAKAVYGVDSASLTYDEILAKINTTGFAADLEEKIINVINKTVIGENLVAENLRIYNTFSQSDKSNLKNWTEASEIEKHYFKGYNITVPAIVKQALANTFENTDTSLYPTVLRQKVSVSDSFDAVTVTENTHAVTLMPKANTPVTKLAFEISGNAGQTVSLNFDVVSGGVKHTVTKTVTLTAEKQTVEVDLTSAGSSLGAFNGSTATQANNALFGNTDVADSNGDNYIALNCSGSAFTIKFTGMYNK